MKQPNNRKLIHIPVIHTSDDMGTLKTYAKKAFLLKSGAALLHQKETLIEHIWDLIVQYVNSLKLEYQRVKIYQDGLPVCGKELEIVSDLAKSGSRNHKLVLALAQKGATIMGTESAGLLVQEYQLVKTTITKASTKAEQVIKNNSVYDELLKKRDEFIAHRILNTLQSNETGILFLGMLHNVNHLFKNKINVIQFRETPSA